MKHTITMDVEAPDEMTVDAVVLWVEQALQMRWEQHLFSRAEGLHPTQTMFAVVHTLPDAYALYGVSVTWKALLGDKDVKHILPWPAMPTVGEAAYAAWRWINHYRGLRLLPNFLSQAMQHEQ